MGLLPSGPVALKESGEGGGWPSQHRQEPGQGVEVGLWPSLCPTGDLGK